MRPVDFCKPTDLPSTCGSFDSSTFVEGDKVDALFLASAFAIASPRSFSSFTAMSPALSSRLGIESVAVREPAVGRPRDLNRWLSYAEHRWSPSAMPTFANGVSGLHYATGGDASDTIVARRVVSDSFTPRTPLSRRFVKSFGLVSPWCLRSCDCASMS